MSAAFGHDALRQQHTRKQKVSDGLRTRGNNKHDLKTIGCMVCCVYAREQTRVQTPVSQMIQSHIRVRRMWEFSRDRASLTLEEHQHIGHCDACLSLFKLCVIAQSPQAIDLDTEIHDEFHPKKTA
jgi:hypothetical protein